MGFRCSWIAVKNAEVNAIPARRKWSAAQTLDEAPEDVGTYTFRIGEWSVLFADGSDSFLKLEAADATEAREFAEEVVFFTCSDTVMNAMLEHWSKERHLSVFYDGMNGVSRPQVDGELSESERALLQELLDEQSEDSECDHLYEFCAELGQRLVGFRHGYDIDGQDWAELMPLEEDPLSVPITKGWRARLGRLLDRD